jgi:hypothetical protein
MNKTDSLAMCTHCTKILKVPNGSTKGLHDHLQRKHSITVHKLQYKLDQPRKRLSDDDYFEENFEDNIEENPTHIDESPEQFSDNYANLEKDGFEDISENSKSKVWTHFLANRSEYLAKCLYCTKIIKTQNGSTKNLHVHLQNRHAITAKRVPWTKNNLDKDEFYQDYDENTGQFSEIEDRFEKDGFKDISSTNKSQVWVHFLQNKVESLAKCLHCSKLLKTSGSTKSLHDHLKNKHTIALSKISELPTKKLEESEDPDYVPGSKTERKIKKEIMPSKFDNYDENEVKPFGCDDCDVRFTIEDKLIRHVLSVHKGRVSDRMICEQFAILSFQILHKCPILDKKLEVWLNKKKS